MARLAADAKTVVEEIHAASAGEAAELRRHADDDVAAVREWSKAEIARIREETEARIALRKTALDSEMDQHGLIVDLKTAERLPSAIGNAHGRQGAVYARAHGNYGMRMAYVKPSAGRDGRAVGVYEMSADEVRRRRAFCGLGRRTDAFFELQVMNLAGMAWNLTVV